MQLTRQERKRLETENRKRPLVLKQVPPESWPAHRPEGLKEVWQSRDFLVQIYQDYAQERMSVCRTTVDPRTDRWNDGIAWDDLQNLKRQCGRGKVWAVEIYPADGHLVNEANMRHLWLLPEAPEFAWKK